MDPSFYMFFIINLLSVYACQSTHAKVREQRARVIFFFLSPYEFWWSNSIHQAWWKEWFKVMQLSKCNTSTETCIEHSKGQDANNLRQWQSSNKCIQKKEYWHNKGENKLEVEKRSSEECSEEGRKDEEMREIGTEMKIRVGEKRKKKQRLWIMCQLNMRSR